ncbi:MAG: hypothetical protein INF92_12485 [Rhodobacter sp.]|nr:hypothetical protein [Rhodobacter sp.]
MGEKSTKPKITFFRLVVLGFIGLAIVGAVTDQPASKTTPAAVATPQAAPSTEVTAKAPPSGPLPMPADQIAFHSIIEASRQAYDDAPNDLVRGAERPKRSQAICDAVQSHEVKEWIGQVYKLTGTADGRGVISIELAGDIWLSTWNNASSDIKYATLINPGSDLFSRISTLSEGDEVVFSGTFFPDGSGKDCFNEISLMESSSMSQPEFVFAFSDVRANDGETAPLPSATTVTKAPAAAHLAAPQPTPEEVAAKERDKAFGLWCLSAWDGSHPEFVKAVQDRLNDPDSFQHDDTMVWTVRPDGRNQIVMAFRARNGFGGTVRHKAAGTFDNKTCSFVEIDLIE